MNGEVLPRNAETVYPFTDLMQGVHIVLHKTYNFVSNFF